jgi:multidrug resistance efflux pump
MKVVDHLKPTQVSHVKIGQKVKVFVTGHDKAPVEGSVSFISSIINLGQVKVEISVVNVKNPNAVADQYPYLYRDGIKARIQW